MRLPVKLNESIVPLGFPARGIWRHLRRLMVKDPRLLVRRNDPLPPQDFAQAVSVLKFGTTFKTTSAGRHRESTIALLDLVRNMRPGILDIGASDGSTSLDLLHALQDNISFYYVTDANLEVWFHLADDGTVYFYDGRHRCILIAAKSFVVYSDTDGAIPLLRLLVEWCFRRCPVAKAPEHLELVQPELLERSRRDPRVHVEQYDVFQPWTGPRPDVVKIANVLNRAYFSDIEIRAAVASIHRTLMNGGWLLVVENRAEIERSSFYLRESDRFREERTINGGVEIADLVSCPL